MSLRAIVFGASGMVGEGVLIEALNDADVDSVLVVGRRSCGRSHPKITELLHKSFFDFSTIERELTGFNACFFCLGVSSVGMKEPEYTRITHDLTLHAANTLSRLNPDMTFCYVSGTGTDSTEQGRMMWARVKGRTENHLARLPFKAVYLFRPGLMKPNEGQMNIKPVFRFAASTLYPLFKAIAPKSVCTLADLGRAMLNVSRFGYEKKILENLDITRIAGMGKRT